MARVTYVASAYKPPGHCGRCGVEIKKGEPYKHASPGFRGRKLVRCGKPTCAFRPSELTTSLTAGVYAAQETAHDDLDALVGGDFIDTSDVESILSAAADEARGVAEEYASAADAMGSAGEEHQERADLIEAWADDLEGVTFDEPPESDEDEDSPQPEGGADPQAMEDEWESWREGVIEAAREAIDAFEG